MPHELIDREYPTCLYCDGEVELNFSSKWNINHRTDEETITCLVCQEIFKIYSSQDDTGRTEYEAFSFSCNEILVYCDYKLSEIIFADLRVPAFSIDFCNKEKLHQKLKTYILFS